MNKVKIAVIDSGIGGLSLLKVFLNNLKDIDYIYFADLKNLPYGTKTKEQLLCITIKNIRYIKQKYNPDLIVFGCNTIGTTIYEEIKKIFPKQKIFSIRPCIKNDNVKTLVLATTATINYLQSLEIYKKNEDSLVLCKMPRLATKVESYIKNGHNLVPYIKNKLNKFKGIKRVVLGCSHYFFIKDIISKVLPNSKIIDSTTYVLGLVKKYIKLFYQNKNILKISKNNKIYKSKTFSYFQKSNSYVLWHLTKSNSNLNLYKNILNNHLNT